LTSAEMYFTKKLFARTSMVGEGTPPLNSDHVRVQAKPFAKVVSTLRSFFKKVGEATGLSRRRETSSSPLGPIAASAAVGPSANPQPVVIQAEVVLCEEDKKRVQECVAALYTLLEVYGYRSRNRDPTSKHSYDRTVMQWCRAAALLGTGGWMKWAKYKLACYFHAQTKQHDSPPENPLPDFPDRRDVLCRGSAHRFMKLMLQSRHRWSLLASILQVKKGCPRPGQDLVSLAVQKAQLALTTIRPNGKCGFLIDWADAGNYEDIYLHKGSMQEQLRRTVREIFSGCRYTDSDRYKMIFPSTSASYSTSKANGGKFNDISDYIHRSGQIYRNPAKIDGGYDERLQDDTEEGVAFRMERYAKLDALAEERGIKKGSTAYLKLWHDELYRHPQNGFITMHQKMQSDEENEWIGKGNHTFVVDLRRIEEQTAAIYENLLIRAGRKRSTVLCVGLAESLKVRVITAGDAYKAKVLHPLQKFMWRKLVQHDTFTLTGRPVDPWIIQERLGAHLAPGQYYLSGDYSAATDNLAPWVTETIGREIAKVIGLRPEEEELFIENLVGNWIDMADKRDNMGNDIRRQMWGQLMGSIVSFPILCIANAAFCRWAIEIERDRKVPLSNSGLLINGDDVVFKTTKKGHEIWKRITAYGGLESSVGKTFLSEEFAQINSVNFRRLDTPTKHQFYSIEKGSYTRDLWFEQTPYINLGLLYGMKRSGEKVGRDAIADTTETLGARCRDLIGNAPAELRHPLMKLFLRHHDDLLKSVRVPRYVPEQWGGVGLPTVPSPQEEWEGTEPRFGPTLLDRKGGARIAEMPKLPNGRLRYPVGAPLADVEWLTHGAVMEKLPEISYGYPSDRQKADYQRLYSSVAWDCFLRDDYLRDAVLVHNKLDYEASIAKGKEPRVKWRPKVSKVLKQNEKSWAQVIKDGNLRSHPPRASWLFSRDSPKAFLDVEFLSNYSNVSREVLHDDALLNLMGELNDWNV